MLDVYLPRLKENEDGRTAYTRTVPCRFLN